MDDVQSLRYDGHDRRVVIYGYLLEALICLDGGVFGLILGVIALALCQS